MDEANPIITSVLNDCITAFVCPVGEFYPNKDYGSQIKRHISSIDKEHLLSYARQAIRNMDGVYVKTVSSDNAGVRFTVMINEEERQVHIPL